MFSSLRVVIAGGLATVACVSVVAGQAAQPAQSSVDVLVTEIRALRAEMSEAARAGMRAQLLGIRLQLQEQRIGVVARQLGDVRDRQKSSDQARATLSAQMKIVDDMRGAADARESKEFDQMFAPLTGQLAALEQADQQLKSEEAALVRLLGEEQSRWTGFNAQVEQLERASAGKPVR